MRISIIITTYNRPDALSLVLMGLSRQTCDNFEVLIADDGSTASTAEVVAQAWPFPLKHVWQEDDGFRAGQIRNRAVKLARGEYLVFLDGDCVPGPKFVEQHYQLAEPGWFVAGNRVLLNPQFTAEVLQHPQRLLQLSAVGWLRARWQGSVNRILPLLPLPMLNRKGKANEWRGVKTCNLGMWRSDFDAVHGFDEAYVGWGYEDSDLVVRLLNDGIKRKQGRFLTVVLHLWHPENTRENTAENWQRLLTTQQQCDQT